MNPDWHIIPIEAKLPRGVMVTRLQFEGVNRYGKPNSHILGDELFYSFLDAFQFAAEDQTVNNRFTTYLRFPIAVKLIGLPKVDEKLIVEIGGARGVSPRTVDNHHSVSADDSRILSLNIERVGKVTTFDRGLAWIWGFNPPSWPLFDFTVLGHKHGWTSNLEQELKGLLKRSNDVLGDLVAGMSTEAIEGGNV